jgi:phosphatidylglycerophosphatase GEP4
MIFIGDRYLTDVVFGNRHGMLTVRVAPLTSAGEPPGVLVARRVEEFCVQRWVRSGVRPPPQQLLPATDYPRMLLSRPSASSG